MNGILVAGFFLGMSHATEADHVAAVATLAAGGGDLPRMLRLGALWGLGHMSMLVLIGGLALAAGTFIPASLERGMEALVGVMLILLGADVLWRVRRLVLERRAAPDGADARATHPMTTGLGQRPPWRAYVVGLVHGMAGSAALVVLAASRVDSPALGMAYVVLFGLGSVAGMVAVSLGLALPFHFTARRVPALIPLVCLVSGVVSLVVGTLVLVA
ncbi:MAG: urease accessory protein [Myxococcota bacterium]